MTAGADIRALTEDFAVSPQILPEDLPAIFAAGYRTVICNRPDAEIPADIGSAAMAAAAEAAGLAFVDNPIGRTGLTPDMLDRQRMGADAGPVLAYCASGTRSTLVWAFSRAGEIEVDQIVEAALKAGYDLSQFRAQIEAAAARG